MSVPREGKWTGVQIKDAGGTYNPRPLLHFASATERFHLWLDPVTLAPEVASNGKTILYGNPLTRQEGARRARTRNLDATSKTWAPVIARLFATLDLDAERARLKAERAQRERDAETDRLASWRREVIREQAEALYARTLRRLETCRALLIAPGRCGCMECQEERVVVDRIESDVDKHARAS